MVRTCCVWQGPLIWVSAGSSALKPFGNFWMFLPIVQHIDRSSNTYYLLVNVLRNCFRERCSQHRGRPSKWFYDYLVKLFSSLLLLNVNSTRWSRMFGAHAYWKWENGSPEHSQQMLFLVLSPFSVVRRLCNETEHKIISHHFFRASISFPIFSIRFLCVFASRASRMWVKGRNWIRSKILMWINAISIQLRKNSEPKHIRK